MSALTTAERALEGAIVVLEFALLLAAVALAVKGRWLEASLSVQQMALLALLYRQQGFVRRLARLEASGTAARLDIVVRGPADVAPSDARRGLN